MTDPNQLIEDYEQRTAALLERAAEAKSQIANLTGAATSTDGAVTVSVSAGGALLNLSFGTKADDMPKDRLAALVMSTAKRAQAQAVGQIATIMAPLIGDNSEAMQFVQSQIPPIEVPDEPAPAAPQQFVVNEEQQDAAAAEPPAPRPVRRPAEDDDTDYDQRSLFKKEGGW
ncbi:YbaB/EbfC DNA-binding family protein [Lentzea albidocapillata subsp. violacea]|uniref:YbaB/EbfC DNA-binding family protein n=1 Tax=Lentzea albidocapillata subsp. violacea TaxID=128104 RepID=A0A1G9I3N3_9PSEU|nr:YbaB/EbfC family nucleoid-associated protein [Lentzea albidocapillata]SDL19809.1 YbaB/EbfC DNA-binding family protein [Lentzea albidocapillata subsp. violacea]